MSTAISDTATGFQAEHGGSTWNLPDPLYDLVVVGAGHAGIEAALAGARQGLRTLLVSMSLNTIGQLSCNPAVGGVGKGQLVREIDALGGEMGRLADRSGLQFRMLNQSKGPAVWSPRAQCDKALYAQLATRALHDQIGLDLRQGDVADIEILSGRVCAVILSTGTRIRCGAVILCAGTFLNGLVHVGSSQTSSGRAGEPAARDLSAALLKNGIRIQRYKTGTPPRVDRDSIRWSAFEEQAGDVHPCPFRFYENLISQPQQLCHITWTNEATHRLLRDNLSRSPMYAGLIEGVGPRYCPSVEDKVVRFADKERHQVFLEPETLNGREMYVNGFSTSMPEDVQLAALRTVPGFEDVRIVRPGYAIEYDYFPAWQLDSSLRVRGVDNLYFAGQINGSSGYEEAAAQGLMAAIHAASRLSGTDAPAIGRDVGYLGVLLDDLVSKPMPEPYRMFTSRAEFRLLLRQDNADQRLMPIAHQLGLCESWRWENFLARREWRERLHTWLSTTTLTSQLILSVVPNDTPASSIDVPPLDSQPLAQRAADWLRRPEISLRSLLSACPQPWFSELDHDLITGVEVDVKYAGYIERQRRSIENFHRNEDVALPEGLDYANMRSLSSEARQRLQQVRPSTLGQASRVGGVSPTDIQALWVQLQRKSTAPRLGGESSNGPQKNEC